MQYDTVVTVSYDDTAHCPLTAEYYQSAVQYSIYTTLH